MSGVDQCENRRQSAARRCTSAADRNNRHARLREDDVVASVLIPAFDMRRAKESVAPDIYQYEHEEYQHEALHNKGNLGDPLII